MANVRTNRWENNQCDYNHEVVPQRSTQVLSFHENIGSNFKNRKSWVIRKPLVI